MTEKSTGEDLSIFVTTRDGVVHEIPALSGWSLMEIIRDAGLSGIKAECGGALSCATCQVYIDEPWASRVTPPREDECAMITDQAMNPRPTSRLSCQVLMRDDLNGLAVTIAANPD